MHHSQINTIKSKLRKKLRQKKWQTLNLQSNTFLLPYHRSFVELLICFDLNAQYNFTQVRCCINRVLLFFLFVSPCFSFNTTGTIFFIKEKKNVEQKEKEESMYRLMIYDVSNDVGFLIFQLLCCMEKISNKERRKSPKQINICIFFIRLIYVSLFTRQPDCTVDILHW